MARGKPPLSDTIFPGQLAQENLRLKNEKRAIEKEERENRRMLIDTFFSNAPYGRSKLNMDDGRTAVLTQGQRYKVEEAMLPELREEMKEQFGVNIDAIFKWKPELNKKVYDELSDDERAVFDQCLTITDDSPQLEFTEPKNWRNPYEEN
jgi:hypothetical protein